MKRPFRVPKRTQGDVLENWSWRGTAEVRNRAKWAAQVFKMLSIP